MSFVSSRIALMPLSREMTDQRHAKVSGGRSASGQTDRVDDRQRGQQQDLKCWQNPMRTEEGEPLRQQQLQPGGGEDRHRNRDPVLTDTRAQPTGDEMLRTLEGTLGATPNLMIDGQRVRVGVRV
jgi:hypothetical protein